MRHENPGGQQPGLSQSSSTDGSRGNVPSRPDAASRLRRAKVEALWQWIARETRFTVTLSDVYGDDEDPGFGQFANRDEADASVCALIEAGRLQIRAQRGKVALIALERH